VTAPRIYLAGPMVFYPDPDATFQRMKQICQHHGLIGVSPLDNQIGLEGAAPDRTLLQRIVKADLALMDTLDGGLFCLDPFRRAPDMDPGTAFEVGYMRALKKPMAGWTHDPRDYPAKVRAYFATVFKLDLTATAPGTTGGTSGTTRDPDGILAHSQGCLQNAMIDIGLGEVFADPDWEAAFDRATAHLAALLSDRVIAPKATMRVPN
jgi:nucleoside 2-deoxyribosyltransferase